MIFPMSTSKAAEEESPLPAGISEEISASKPPKTLPLSMKEPQTPRISAMGLPDSSGRGSKSPSSSSKEPKPSEFMRIRSVSVRLAAAVIPRLTPAPRTQPPWWSVWFPPSSVRPGTKKNSLISLAPFGKVYGGIISQRRALFQGGGGERPFAIYVF